MGQSKQIFSNINQTDRRRRREEEKKKQTQKGRTKEPIVDKRKDCGEIGLHLKCCGIIF
jgi:hypothetical protein